ncbi:hypothetical protein T440DRAFT_463111 [Plenodomus tracheiphilus IPT5]|uniref:Uncharacterized protein n=1 Tax=Plenodomus tracheiphilus IPT5 TaxID=1408161 RepID=A0A6A7BQH2_9PLEO|nr:hypothetical protein T440DRAFT_463111 [Plenodomus tracheiphilus IPT5]
MSSTQFTAPVNLPRVAISYCIQCKWMLRAAYFGQELLSTFGTQIGEIALIPSTGGLFQVHLTYVPVGVATAVEGGEGGKGQGKVEAQRVLLWDRKSEGGFPETKVLKQKVRDCIDPNRDLGHSDKGGKKKDAVKEKEVEVKSSAEGPKVEVEEEGGKEVKRNADGSVCEDCQ